MRLLVAGPGGSGRSFRRRPGDRHSRRRPGPAQRRGGLSSAGHAGTTIWQRDERVGPAGTAAAARSGRAGASAAEASPYVVVWRGLEAVGGNAPRPPRQTTDSRRRGPLHRATSDRLDRARRRNGLLASRCRIIDLSRVSTGGDPGRSRPRACRANWRHRLQSHCGRRARLSPGGCPPRSLAGFGYIAGPQRTRRDLLGVQWCSSIFPERARPDTSPARLCGGWHRAEVAGWDDERLLAAVRAELRLAMRIQSPPQFHRIVRWDWAIPQYRLGPCGRVALIEERIARHSGPVPGRQRLSRRRAERLHGTGRAIGGEDWAIPWFRQALTVPRFVGD